MAPVIDCSADNSSDDGSNASKMILRVPLLPPLDADEASEESLDASSSAAASALRSRISASLSSSCPSSTLTCALRDIQLPSVSVKDPLSSSCFAQICLGNKLYDSELSKVTAEDDDDDLTSLDWLQDINLLQNMASSDSTPTVEIKSENVDHGEFATSAESYYDPKCNPCVKPPYSFSVLIFMAIEASPRRRLPVKDIYNWIAEHFPFYRRAPVGWRNSVRHNLSLNKCFRKVERTLGKGSSWCIDPLFRPNLLQAMRRTPYFPFQQLQMTSSGSSHSSCGDDSMAPSPCGDDVSVKSECDGVFQSSELLPFLSRRLAQVQQNNDADDIDLANTLASLKTSRHSAASNRQRLLQKIKVHANLVDLACTPAPHLDHSYSCDGALVDEVLSAMACDDVSTTAAEIGTAVYLDDGSGSPVDEVYDFGEIYCESDQTRSVSESEDNVSEDSETEKAVVLKCRRGRPPRKVTSQACRSKRKFKSDENDEERKRLDGVDALLDLASGVGANSASQPSMLSPKRKKVLPLSSSLWANAATEQLKRKRIIQQRKMKKLVRQMRKKGGPPQRMETIERPKAKTVSLRRK